MPTAIEIKVQQLLDANFSLGPKISNEVTTSYGGKMQEYEEATLYYHPVMGTSAHEVHGAIRTKYLRLGGFDKEPISGNRHFGFPLSDEQDSKDSRCRSSKFEWGAIYWIFGGVAIYGKIYEKYLEMGAEGSSIGYPLSDPIKIGDGDVVFFEFGCMYCGTKSDNKVVYISYSFPQLGRPWMINQEQINDNIVIKADFSASSTLNNNLPQLFEEIHKDKLFLKATGSTVKIPLKIDRSDARELTSGFPPMKHIVSNLRLQGNVELKNRQLYDLVISLPSTSYTLAPHSVYIKKDWKDFRFMHATDLHISKRIDGWRKFFKDRSMDDAVKNFNNFNDNLREVIKYANKLHLSGSLDFIIMTGDLVDYIFEDGGKKYNNNNFVYLEKIIRGLNGKPDKVEEEELKVPILTSLGNHDYRTRSYYPLFTVDFPFPISNKEMPHFGAFNLTRDEAKHLSEYLNPNGMISTGTAADMIQPDRDNKSGNLNHYFRHICRNASYVQTLGDHQIIMIDGKWDDGTIEGTWDAINHFLGYSNEATENFAVGAPDTVGFTQSEIDIIKKALEKDGLVIVGVHAPLINPTSSEYPYFLRSSIRSKSPEPFTNEMRKYLFRMDPLGFTNMIDNGTLIAYMIDLRKDIHPSWPRKKTTHFHEGNGGDLLDQGIMRGRNEEVLKLCAGISGSSRPVDLILSGHVHKNWECTLQWSNIEKRFHIRHDFYTENPSVYYHSYDNEINAETGFTSINPPGPLIAQTLKRIHVTVTDDAGDNEKPVKGSSGVWSIKTKSYFPTINSLTAAGRKLTWGAMRPFLIQTAAVGPSESLRNPERQPDFRGCRIISVSSDAIENIRYVTNANIKSFLSRGPVSTDGGTVLTR